MSKSYGGAIVYHQGLAAGALLENYKITRYTVNKQKKIEAKFKARGNYMTSMVLNGADNMRYKQLK